MSQHHRHQRDLATVALTPQRLQHVLERHRLVREAIQYHLTRAQQHLLQARIPRQVHPQRQNIDEKADQLFQLQLVAAGDRRADAHVLAIGVTAQHQRQARQQAHEQRRLVLLAVGRQLLGQLRRIAVFDQPRPPRPRGAARPVVGQVQAIVVAFQCPRPVRQRSRQLPLPLPQRVVGILHRQRRQCGGRAAQTRLVQLVQVTVEHSQRPAVGNDVVDAAQHHMVIGRHAQDACLEQGPLPQIESLPRARGQQQVDLLGRHLAYRHLQRQRGSDHLLQLPVLRKKACAQHFVPRHQRVQCGTHRFDAEGCSDEMRCVTDVVAGSLLLHMLVHQP